MNKAALGAIVNIFLPGVGQMLQGRILAGLFFLLGTIGGLFLCAIPGAIVWIISIVEAASYKEKASS